MPESKMSFSLDIRPERLRNQGVTWITIRNEDNRASLYSVTGRDPAEEIEFTGERSDVELAPGQSATVALGVAPARRPLVGSDRVLPFEVRASTPTGLSQVKRGQLEVKPVMPGWLLAVAGAAFAFLCLAGLILFSILSARSQSAEATAQAMAAAAGTMTAMPTLTPLPTGTATATPVPLTCQTIRSVNPNAADGEYTFYRHGDLEQPMTLYCHNMAGNPAEYLTLVNTDESSNYATANYEGATVTTQYEKIRLDPRTLIVDRTDRTFATVSGSTGEGATPPADYGMAIGCTGGQGTGAFGSANINLEGTTFAIDDSVTFVLQGYAPEGGPAEIDPQRRAVNLSATGRCGWMGPNGHLRLKYLPLEE